MPPARVSGELVTIEVLNPDSVTHPLALLATWLQTLGVPQHSRFPFSETVEQIDGETVRRWTWVFQPKSATAPHHATALLIQRWNDPAWLAAHPQSEEALTRTALLNHAVTAREIREVDPREIFRRDDLEVRIPASASPARRAHLIGQFEGRIPHTQPFVEPAAP